MTSSSPTSTCNVVLDIESVNPDNETYSTSSQQSTSSERTFGSYPLRTWLDSAAARLSFSRSTSTQSESGKEPPPCYDIFLGGSCGNTVWRRELVIPYLKKRSITYYDPQRPAWNENMIHEEQIAKEVGYLWD
jgi:hypothetical protein